MPDQIFLHLLIFSVALYGVMKGADWLIEGAGNLARHFRVSELLIGLTIVAFGTSLPELVVSVNAAIQGNPILAYANVIGSNITNILLILGCAAVVYPMTTSPEARRDLGFSFALVVGFFAILIVTVFPLQSPISARLDWWGGAILIAFFITFIGRLFWQEMKSRKNPRTEAVSNEQAEEYNLGLLSLQIVVGLALVIIGGDFTVKSAVAMAQKLGVSESTIGLTIVALGTSLPELVASLVAAGKQKSDIALGNILGSNIMNVALVLASSAMLSPFLIDFWGVIDMVIMTIVSLLFLGLLMKKNGPNISRQTGGFFLILYVAYMLLIGMRSQLGA
ncbi:MAG: calcium/sodium antiporter [Oligoflexus sp.]